MLAAALLTFASLWLAAPAPTQSRVTSVLGSGPSPPRAGRAQLSGMLAGSRTRAGVCLIAAALTGWAFDGPAGGAVGSVAGMALAWWIGRLESPDTARMREQVTRDLPLAIDLLSACAAVGSPTDRALGVVSQAVGGPLAARFDGLRARLDLGADPAVEWKAFGADQQLAPLARTITRAFESGSPVAAGLSRLAEDTRRLRRTHSQIRARSVGVKAAGPLALCFLPAFMLIGVVPTVAGAFSRLLL